MYYSSMNEIMKSTIVFKAYTFISPWKQPPPHTIVFNHAEISSKTLVSWSHFIHLWTIASSWSTSSIIIIHSCCQMYVWSKVVCFALFCNYEIHQTGVCQMCSWYLWKALEEEGCISLVSWHLDLCCKKFLNVEWFFH
jgi:hypothetical protein